MGWFQQEDMTHTGFEPPDRSMNIIFSVHTPLKQRFYLSTIFLLEQAMRVQKKKQQQAAVLPWCADRVA